MKTLARPFELKAVGDDGIFEGYGSVFGVVDSYKDVVLPGAFLASIQRHKDKGAMPALLWQHRSGEPIGVWEDMSEDQHGLKMVGRLALDVQRGREAHALLKMGAVRGLSIGYSVPAGGSEYDKEAGVQELKQIDLWETSLVTFPANPEANVTEVRANLQKGFYPSLREMERMLRDSGFSKQDAQAILSNGYGQFAERDAGDAAVEEIFSTFKRIFHR